MSQVQTESRKNWNEETLFFLDSTKDEDLLKPHPSPMNLAFYASGLISVVCMFFGWLSVDLDLGFMQIGDLLEDITIFGMPTILKDLENGLGVLTSLLPAEVNNTIQLNIAICYAVVLMAIVGAVLFVASGFLRFQKNKLGYTTGLLSGVLIVLAAAVFAIQVMVLFSSIGSAIGVDIVEKSLSVPWFLCMAGGITACVSAGKDYRKNLIVLCDGRTAIDMGDKWKCRCGKKNLAALNQCYYCGQTRQNEQ